MIVAQPLSRRMDPEGNAAVDPARLSAPRAKLGIVLHDHLVIGRGRHVSFRAQGLL